MSGPMVKRLTDFRLSLRYKGGTHPHGCLAAKVELTEEESAELYREVPYGVEVKTEEMKLEIMPVGEGKRAEAVAY